MNKWTAFVVLICCHTATAQLRYTVVKKDTTMFDKQLGDIKWSQYKFQGAFNLASSEVDNAEFNLSEFNKIGDFDSTQFNGRANIDNVTFNGLANFLRAQFKGRANFGGTVFKDECIMEGSTFESDALFFNCNFQGYADFINTKFLEQAHFSGAEFGSRAVFGSSVFAQEASFKGVKVLDDLTFSNTVFLDNLDFSNATNIKNRIDLTVVNTDTIKDGMKTRRGINLTNSDIAKFKIDYSLFYLEFDSSASYEYRSNVYQTLLNTFKNDGYTESYEILDKEYKDFAYDKKNMWFIRTLDKYWWDYGYAKQYIFYWTFGFLAWFTLCNFFLYPFLQREVYKINHIETNFKSSKWKVGQRLYYSLVYTSVLFFSISVKLDNLKYKHWLAVAYIFLIYVLGIICLAYTANFVITK